jgi:hypothetical protein
MADLKYVDPNPNVLGFRIVSNKKSNDITGLYTFTVSLLDLILSNPENIIVDIPFNYMRTINVATPEFSIFDFSLTQEQKDELYNCGLNAANNFFD